MNASAVWARLLVAAIFWLPALAASAQDARPEHPLDALTATELRQVKQVLAADGKLGPKARVHAVDLDEPAKATVAAWRPGMALPRRAVAVVSEAGSVHEAAIDLVANRVTGVRYGLHYMYSNDNRFTGNEFRRNAAGAAIMFSNRISHTGSTVKRSLPNTPTYSSRPSM